VGSTVIVALVYEEEKKRRLNEIGKYMMKGTTSRDFLRSRTASGDGTVGTCEGWRASEHVMGENAEAPPVHLLPMPAVGKN
jgi:hypothetical protein